MIRDGYIASWRGGHYEASPGADSAVRLYTTEPAEGFEETRPGRYRRVVPDAEIETLSYVRTVCTWRGERFVIVGEYESWLRVEYTGGLAPVAEALGLDRIDHGVWQTWAPLAEVIDVHEEMI
ncbi:MAG: hypothetical protein JWO67_2549 [Streptosporangiaceae bacterium]|jgi:hypothetical protein|nr:hypothetical protein [Streptosporangiaceae bacterium]